VSSYSRDCIAVDRWRIPAFGDRYLFDISLAANATVAAALRTWPRVVGTDALFAGLNGPMVTRAFWRACRKAEVPNLRLYDLRHTFASYLAMGGFNLRAIQQLLGHKDLRMTARYAHLSADHLRQAVNSLDTVLGLKSFEK
jgi:integrase